MLSRVFSFAWKLNCTRWCLYKHYDDKLLHESDLRKMSLLSFLIFGHKLTTNVETTSLPPPSRSYPQSKGKICLFFIPPVPVALVKMFLEVKESNYSFAMQRTQCGCKFSDGTCSRTTKCYDI